MASSIVLHEVPAVLGGFSFGRDALVAFRAVASFGAVKEAATFRSVSFLDVFRPLSAPSGLALTFPTIVGPTFGVKAVVVRASEAEAGVAAVSLRAATQFIVAEYGRATTGAAALRALVACPIEEVVFPVAVLSATAQAQPLYVGIPLDAPEAAPLCVTEEDASAFVGVQLVPGVGLVWYLSWSPGSASSAHVVRVDAERVLELACMSAFCAHAQLVLVGVGLFAGEGAYSPLRVGWLADLLVPRPIRSLDAAMDLRPTVVEALGQVPVVPTTRSMRAAVQQAFAAPAGGGAEPRRVDAGAGGLLASAPTEARAARVGRSEPSKLPFDPLGYSEGEPLVELTPAFLKELEGWVKFALDGFLECDMPSVPEWAGAVERATRIWAGEERGEGFRGSSKVARPFAAVVSDGAGMSRWRGGGTVARALNALEYLCRTFPAASFEVSGASNEAAEWAPRGDAVQQWLDGCLMIGYVVVAACPAVGSDWNLRAPGLVVRLEAGEWHVLCMCRMCSFESSLRRRIRPLAEHARHMCARRVQCDCACYEVPGHVFVLTPVDVAPPSPKAPASDGESEGVSAESEADVRPGFTTFVRPLWRWARMEQYWCVRRMPCPSFDWDKLRCATPVRLPVGEDGIAPPAGWEGNGFPGGEAS